jgi:short-subunit dehydrogenase
MMQLNKQKYGPWAVVTGASDGIGRAMAVLLAEAGFNLALVARRGDLLSALSADLIKRFAVETLVLATDLTQPGAVDGVLHATDQLEIGLLVASAGFGSAGRFLDLSLDSELNMLDLNCRTVLAMSHHYGRRFAKQGRGGLILVSSLLAFQGVPFSAHYAATKAYVQTLAEGLHRELAPLGVDVLASAPGPINTGFAARASMQMGTALQPEVVARETLGALGRKITVRPGWLSKLLESGLSVLPRNGRSWVMGRVMKGMSQG